MFPNWNTLPLPSSYSPCRLQLATCDKILQTAA